MPAAAVAAAVSVTEDSGDEFSVFDPKLDRAPDVAYDEFSALFSDPARSYQKEREREEQSVECMR